jgi:hypothetical protein
VDCLNREMSRAEQALSTRYNGKHHRHLASAINRGRISAKIESTASESPASSGRGSPRRVNKVSMSPRDRWRSLRSATPRTPSKFALAGTSATPNLEPTRSSTPCKVLAS